MDIIQSLDDYTSKRAQLDQEMAQLRDQGIERVQKLIDQFGIAKRDLRFKGIRAGQPKRCCAAVYKSPEGKIWSGRGRIPQWIKDVEAQGGSREDYRA